MIHRQFHCNEIHTIWYLLLNMFSIAVILMKHIYMYNTTFCLNSPSLAFFFLILNFCNIYTTHTHWMMMYPPTPPYLPCIEDDASELACLVCVLCLCVHTVGQFDNRGPFCYAGQLTLRHNL